MTLPGATRAPSPAAGTTEAQLRARIAELEVQVRDLKLQLGRAKAELAAKGKE